MDTGDDRLRAYELGCLADVTQPVQVRPCGHCAPWHVEIYRNRSGGLSLREWHDATCEDLLALQQDDRADAKRD